VTKYKNQNFFIIELIIYILIVVFISIFLLENIFQYYIYSEIPIDSAIFNLVFKIFIVATSLSTLVFSKYYLKIDQDIFNFVLLYIFTSIILVISSNFEYIGYLYSLVYSSIILFFSYFLFKYQPIPTGSALTLFFIINGLWLLSQVLGLSEFLYFFQNYVQVVGDEKFDFVLFLQTDNKDIVPAQQFRPSGLFTNTIYLSLFLITYLGFLIFSKSNSKIYRYLFAGFILPFSGSSLVFIYGVISFISIFYNKKMAWFLTGFIISFIVANYYFPVFIETNFNLENTLSSIRIRMDFELEHSNSFFSENIIFSFVTLVFVILFFLNTLIRNIHNFIFYFLIISLALLPLLVHPIFHYSGYAFLLGLLFAFISKNNDSNRQYLN
jgi:hypothetical protein